MAILRRIPKRKISICLFSIALCILFAYKLVSENYLTLCAPALSVDIQKYTGIEDMYQFNHDDIRFLNRTPGFRYFDDHLISSQNNIYLEEYKFHYCKIDKNMGSTMQAFLCYIDSPQNHSEFFFNGSWNAGLAGSDCMKSTVKGDLRQRFMKGAENVDFFNEKSGIYHLAIVRNPISRFVSAFVDVCVAHTYEKQYPNKAKTLCFSCRSNLTCFLPLLHDYLYRLSEHLPKDRWHRDWHFYPQAWYCDFDRQLKQYHLLRYKRNEEFYKELMQIFRNLRVESNLTDDIERQLRTKEAAHATFTESAEYEKLLWENSLLLEYVYKIYYLDFAWFDYRL